MITFRYSRKSVQCRVALDCFSSSEMLVSFTGNRSSKIGTRTKAYTGVNKDQGPCKNTPMIAHKGTRYADKYFKSFINR